MMQLVSLGNVINNILVNAIISFIFTLISFILLLSCELLFIKARLPWYGSFIPIYNEYLINKLCFKKGYICLIPILSYTFILLQTVFYMLGYLEFNIILFLICYIIYIIYACILMFNIGKRFGVSGWLTLFFIYIMVPVLAFSKNYQYIDE